MISDFRGDLMKYMQILISNLDDIFVTCALISFIIASYLINAILGTYILGVAFLIAAFFAGEWLKSSIAQQIISKFKRKE